MPFFLKVRNPDENFMYSYLCELFFQNNLDLPRHLDRWSKRKLASAINKLEHKYGPVKEVF